MVLEKTLESPLDCKEMQPVHPKGDQSWVGATSLDGEKESPPLWVGREGQPLEAPSELYGDDIKETAA